MPTTEHRLRNTEHETWMGLQVPDKAGELMTASKIFTAQESDAFIEEFELGPWSSGVLSGSKFAVSDLIDIEDRPTGCGNPNWLEKRPPAACNALVLDILFSSGAQCVGKTKVDEFTFSLIGENSFSGTPLNPRSPERVPGGPSSGAASAVACCLVDFAVSLDSAAGTQVTAANCGLWGWRLRRNTAPMAGIMPMAPSFDSVGFLALSAKTIRQLGELFADNAERSNKKTAEIFVLEDCWQRADSQVRDSLKSSLSQLESRLSLKTRNLNLKQICTADGGGDLKNWLETFLELYRMEVWSSIGTWIQDRKPELGKEARMNVHLSRHTNRGESSKLFKRRCLYVRALREFLRKTNAVICIPSVPEPAPAKGFIASQDDIGKYYPATLSMASPGVLAGLPQLSVPVTELDGTPLGLSFVADDEELLLGMLEKLENN